LQEGRKLKGPKVFVTFDADEFLTANFKDSLEWEQICTAPPGTVFRFDWINILPDFRRGWLVYNNPWALVDDGTPHIGNQIHSPRIPLGKNAKYIDLKDIKVLHYQYTDWKRMQSKHCWYQCYECINFPEKRALALYRMYHHMYLFLNRKVNTVSIDSKWLEFYEKRGISMKEITRTDHWWDREVVDMMLEHGTTLFAAAYIWYRDWNALKEKYKHDIFSDLKDPRSIMQKYLHLYLQMSQPYCNSIPIKVIDKLLKLAGY
jgi:hypothetical protein